MMIGGNMGPLLGFLLHTDNNPGRVVQPHLGVASSRGLDERQPKDAESEKIWIQRMIQSAGWNGRLGRRGLVLVLCMAGACASAAHAQKRLGSSDYALHGREWNALTELLAVAAESGIEVRAPARIDLSALSASDGLLLVYPSKQPPRGDLAAFMYEGGRLAVADDFGAGGALLEGFRIERRTPRAGEQVPRLRGNRNVLIATPRVRHALALDVPALVTNHPQTLHHEALEAIFGLDDQRGAVVLAGAVGRGRLVAVGDSSVLINNMLEFRGNRAFARNLVRYLAPAGRLWIAAGDSELVGAYGGAAAGDPLAGLRAGLARLSQVRLPAAALSAMTALMALMLLLAAASALPRSSSLVRAVSLPEPETLAGFAGRVRFFARDGSDLLAPMLAFKLELERALSEVLRVPSPIEPLRIEAALRAAGHTEPFVRAVRALLLELAAHALPAAPKVTPRKFSALVAEGDRILAALRRADAEEA
jgi:hypothetical protein